MVGEGKMRVECHSENGRMPIQLEVQVPKDDLRVMVRLMGIGGEESNCGFIRG